MGPQWKLTMLVNVIAMMVEQDGYWQCSGESDDVMMLEGDAEVQLWMPLHKFNFII